MTQAVDDQIGRSHALFAFDGRRVIGHPGWRLYGPTPASA